LLHRFLTLRSCRSLELEHGIIHCFSTSSRNCSRCTSHSLPSVSVAPHTGRLILRFDFLHYCKVRSAFNKDHRASYQRQTTSPKQSEPNPNPLSSYRLSAHTMLNINRLRDLLNQYLALVEFDSTCSKDPCDFRKYMPTGVSRNDRFPLSESLVLQTYHVHLGERTTNSRSPNKSTAPCSWYF
jgi:hypothetical protein